MDKKWLAVILLVFLSSIFSGVALADDSGMSNSKGYIDWQQGIVEATGVGIAPTGINSQTLANALARRAAVGDAYRNLIEEVEKIRVESDTTVENFEMTSDVVKAKISGLIQGAAVLSEQSLPDGTYQVIVGVRLYGMNSVAAVIREKITTPIVLSEPSPSLNYQKIGALSSYTSVLYTGVVVDTRGFALARAMSPRIYDESGRIIYGNMYVDPDIVVKKGMADYFTTEDNLLTMMGEPRAGTTPIVVKAIGLRDFNTSVVISKVDADMILAANANSGFLDRAAVVFVE